MKYLFVCLILVSSFPNVLYAQIEGVDEELENLLKVKILTARHIGLNPMLIKSVSLQNNKNITIDKLKSVDKEWKNSSNVTPFKLSLQQNEAGLYLKSLVDNNPSIREAVLFDNQGASVAVYPAKINYWQGDDNKWSKSYNNGNGKIYIGGVKFDVDTRKTFVEISAPVLDYTAHKKTAGVVVLGVTVDYESK